MNALTILKTRNVRRDKISKATTTEVFTMVLFDIYCSVAFEEKDFRVNCGSNISRNAIRMGE